LLAAVVAVMTVVHKQVVGLVVAVPVHSPALILFHWEQIHCKHKVDLQILAAAAEEHLGAVPVVEEVEEVEL
jgi:hypothetical protein